MSHPSVGPNIPRGGHRKSASSVPATEALSFLKETRILDSWTVADLAKSLHVSSAEARQIIAALELQGYVKKQGREWTTTANGHAVSGSAMPGYTRVTIERALTRLKNQITEANQDASSAYQIIEAVAFGDFLNKNATRVQAADVGIRLEPRTKKRIGAESFSDHKSEEAFLKLLRNHMSMVRLTSYEEWMSKRSHLRLL